MKHTKSPTEIRYHAMVAQLPCVLCARLGRHTWPVSVHHVRQGQGMAQRAPHALAVALCPECHQGANGLHGDKSLLRIAKVEEMDLLADTIEGVFLMLETAA